MRILQKLTLLLIFFFFYSGYSSSAYASEKRVWVIFSDKGKQSIQAFGKSLKAYNAHQVPDKVLIRRQKARGSSMDALDLPVFQPYIDGVIRLGANLRVTSRWLNGITIEAHQNIISQISRLPYVKSVEPIVSYRSQYPAPKQKSMVIKDRARIDFAPGAESNTSAMPEKYYGVSASQIKQIHADALHDLGYHGEGITIALLDTGFDLSHTALKNVHVLGEYDFVNGDLVTSDEPPKDDIGQDDHGTEVLSIIASNSPGNLMGVAYEAEYLLAKTEKVSDRGLMFEQEVEEDWWIAGLEWAESNGADIVSSSLGYSDWYTYSNMNGSTAKTTIAANIAIEKGVMVVVSAGNEGKSRDWPYISAPSDGYDVVSVGAVNDEGKLADFSSIGPTYDGRIKPDVVAMGDGTYAVDPNNPSGYRKASGTSMATPLVAGTLALLKQALPGFDRPRTLIKLLKYTASKALEPDNKYGWGVINAEAAFKYANFPGSMRELNSWDPAGSVPGSTEIILYPNPVSRNTATGRLNINSSKSMESMEIYSMSGSLVYQRHDLDNARFLIWDLKNEYGRKIASGIYVCVIKNSTGAINTRKIAVVE